MISVVPCKVSRPSRYEGKFVTAKCSSINGGASAEIFRRHSHDKLIARSISFGIKLPEGSAYGNHYYASGFFLFSELIFLFVYV